MHKWSTVLKAIRDVLKEPVQKENYHMKEDYDSQSLYVARFIHLDGIKEYITHQYYLLEKIETGYQEVFTGAEMDDIEDHFFHFETFILPYVYQPEPLQTVLPNVLPHVKNYALLYALDDVNEVKHRKEKTLGNLNNE